MADPISDAPGGSTGQVPSASPAAGPVTFGEVAAPDTAAYRRMRRLLRNAASPASPVTVEELGRLADVAAFFAACSGQVPPGEIGEAELVVFAAEHGVADRFRAWHRADATRRLAETLAAGASPTTVFAEAAGCRVRLVDVALRGTVDGVDAGERVRNGCGFIDVEDAMTAEEYAAALELGRDLADEAVDRGCGVLSTAVLGVGAETAALAVLGTITRTEPVTIFGFGATGTDDRRWSRNVTVLRDAMFRAREVADSVGDVLRIAGGCDLVAAAGFIAQAAVRRTPVILDTTASAVSAVCADALAPGAREWLLAGRLTPAPAHLLALRRLGLQALFAMNAPLGLGTAALQTLPVARAAARIASGCELPEPEGPGEPEESDEPGGPDSPGP